MSSVLELPNHVQMIAYEEAQLLQQLRHRLPEGSAVSPAVTFLTRNELMQEAKGLLPAEDWDRYLLFADSLAQQLTADCITSFPRPLYGDSSSPAEVLAEPMVRCARSRASIGV